MTTDFLDLLEHDLLDAARRRAAPSHQAASDTAEVLPHRRRRAHRSLPLAAALAVLAAASAAGGTLFVLRGSPIPAPAPRDAGPAQTPVPGSSVVSDIRAKDPSAGQLPWTVRVARSRTGLVCSTVGQMDGATFGLTGGDGRFRPLAEGAVNSCSAPDPGHATLVGARVFEAKVPRDVRTVVSGVAPGLRSATLAVTGAAAEPVSTGRDGTFAAVLAGHPEDHGGLTLTLTFADGRSQTETFGRSPGVVPDPDGGHAWKFMASSFGGPPATGPAGPRPTCAQFIDARAVRSPTASPTVCGDLGPARRSRGYFFAVQRLTPGRTQRDPRYGFLAGQWKHHPPRTAVWGVGSPEVRSVTVAAPDGSHDAVTRYCPKACPANILLVLGPDVRPEQLTITVTRRDGTRHVHRGTYRAYPLKEALAR